MAVTSPYVSLANQIAVKHGIDPAIFRALVGAESSWNPSARSGAGAVGLTQVVPRYHPGYDLSTPAGQLEAGASILQANLRQYKGNYRDALSAYNSGRPWSQGQNISETRNYVTKILGSGGRTPADAAGGSVPPAGSPVASIQRDVPALDGARLMALLNSTRQQVLAGKMPGPGYQKQLKSIIAQVGPRQQVASTAQGVGAIVSNAASQAGMAAGALAVKAGEAIVKQAIPYSWGGGNTSGPTYGMAQGAKTKGFDCSSFAQYIWAKAGVSIPRTTYGQIKAGRAVPSLAQAQPGDLLFPSTGHVQIYIGNGHVIEEPHTGGHAQVAPVRSSYIAIRRPG